MNELLPHQEKLINLVINKFKTNNNIVAVTGSSGCGKTYSFQWLYKNFKDYNYERIVFLDSDYYSEDIDYSPFKKALFNKSPAEYFKKGAVEAAKGTPFVGNFASFVVDSLVNSNSNLNEDEQVIVNRMKKELQGKKCCIICDNIHWWDHRSIQLLLMLLKSNGILFGNEYKFINIVLLITDNQKTRNDSVFMNLLTSIIPYNTIEYPNFNYNDFKKRLFDETKHTLLDSQIELLYNLANGHLKIYFEIINEINNNSFDFTTDYNNNLSYLKDMLNKRLKECGATGTQIATVLEYASIIGMSFSSFELEKITDYTKAQIKKIINDSVSMRLTENMPQGYYKFAHDIIREIFKSKVDTEHIEYYSNMSLCLKEIKPGQYLRRAKYMMFALETEQAAVLYCLEIVSQLRIYGNFPLNIKQEIENILSKAQKEYLLYMEKAYVAFNLHDYDSAILNLNTILSYYPDVLLAERDILKLRCYSKKLATDEIVYEINKLDEKRTNWAFDGEKEVHERFSHSLITAFSHLGEIKKAREIEEEVLRSLSSRINFDEDAETRVYVIHRNANAIHGIDTSHIFVERAVSYFGEKISDGIHRNIRQYYTSLINYSAMLIKKGNFSEAYDHTLKALDLEQENKDISFRRPQILRNNFILASVLSNKITADKAIALYEELLSGLSGNMAEKLFYISNQSIMFSINNLQEEALRVLSNEALNHNIKHDKEGIYRYRITTNCAIYKYLIEDSESAIIDLEEQSTKLHRLINGSYFHKKNDIIINIMRSKEKAKGNEWIDFVHHKCPTFQGEPWRYFGLGYAFAALCDWGI